MSQFILHNYFRSSASYRVRIALALKGIPFEYRAVHLLNEGGEQYKAEYQALNPSAEVPTLQHNGASIAQSVAIIEYLEQVKPEVPLFPKNPVAAARVRQFCETINSGIHSYQNLKTLKYLGAEFQMTEEQKNRWLNHWLTAGFKSLEKQIFSTSGEFCFGDSLTAAECFLVPQVFAARRFNVDLAPFPKCLSIADRCEKTEPFQKAHPFRQPDTPAEFKI